MVLLHGFVKKSQNTPAADLKLATQRKKEVDHGKAESPHRIGLRRFPRG